MMRILLVCCDYSLSGGSEKVALKLYNELKQYFDIKIISVYCQNGHSSFDDDNVEYLINRKGSFTKHFIIATKRLSKAALEYKADIIISIGVSASFYVCMSGKLTHKKTVVCEHSNLSNKLYNDLVQIFSRRVAVNCCDKFITLTEEDMNNYVNKFPRHKNKFDYIYNWIDTDPSEDNYTYDIDSKRIITISRIDRVKGFEYSLKAFEGISDKFPDWKWEVYGEGDASYLTELNEYIKNHEIHGFRFMGFCKNTDFVYDHSSIYCCSSIYEGLPLSLIEAKTHKIPIISFDCKTGPKEIVVDNINGFLVKVGDVDSFAHKLSTLMNDAELRRKMSDCSYINIDKFNKNTIIDKWKKLIIDL